MSGTNILSTIALVLAALLVVPLLAAGLISALTTRANTKLLGRFGTKAPLALGWFGVIVHELSHAFLAVIFLHHLDQVKLVQNPFTKDHDGRLGYVSHAWNPSSRYQTVGNFFIGMAPIFGGAFVMWGMTVLLWPALFAVSTMGWAVFTAVAPWRMLLWLYIMLNLSLALNMSDADWQNTRSGMLLYAIILTLVGLVLGCFRAVLPILYTQLLMPLLFFYGSLLIIAAILYLIATLLERS